MEAGVDSEEPEKTGNLRLYDVAIDDWREPTQADIDQLMQTAADYAKLRQVVDQHNAQHKATLAKIRSKHGLPA